MALLDEVRLHLRVTQQETDEEIALLIDAAKRDMRRVGVDPEKVDAEDAEMDPLVKLAICTYAKARYGFDNEDAARFERTYRQMVVDLLHSDMRTGEGQ
jgi:uncharacterized phage protein (predicted DNA packaging)